MKTISRPICRIAYFLLLSVGATGMGIAAPKVDLQEVHFTAVPGSPSHRFETVRGDFRISISTPDNPDNPTAWESAVTMNDLRSGTSCETDSGLILDVYVSTSARLAVVKSYSASEGYLDFYDMGTCRETTLGITKFADSFQIQANKVTVLPGCNDPSDGLTACDAGRVFILEPGGSLTLLREESARLTKKNLGVEFVGRRKFKHPKLTSSGKGELP